MDPEPSKLMLLPLLVFNWTIFAYILGIFVLLFLSGLISASEVAFFSLTKVDIVKAINSKSAKAILVAKLLEQPRKLLATILISNNFINIAIVILSHLFVEQYFGSLEINVDFILFTVDLKIIVELIAITFVILLFGEVLPKIYANKNAMQFASKTVYIISFLKRTFLFLSIPLTGLTNLIEHKLRKKSTDISVEKLSKALELTKENASKEERKILKGIVNFGNTEARQIMIPRMDVFALSKDEKYQEVLKKVVENGYSRIPVYDDTIDTIKGILYAKDLLPYLNESDFKWTKLLRESFYVPENKKLDDLLKEFQSKKIHLAVVVDEYGGTSGILSLEDIIEQIVGEISDEYDQDETSYSKIDDYNFIFEGKTTLKVFCNIINMDESEFEDAIGEAETLAGFLLELNGNFPNKNDKIKFKSLIFTIEVIDNKRIKQIKVTKKPKNV
ncbi:MAG: gliding motility-associated protein GldE [Flavobacteriales bacterium CG_4_9_14_0_2_um_filter_35_242]|nr:gliding motility-associated protein GldE [Zetaproteobacteria bacterium]NDK17720.1 gliding motility-associated protein GldE [Flavobacteriales bacterium]PIV16908.1 MAG: gliding motility-associated protein GldE [Flavobacteriales bacterium CG03_land_8_20_14_0_80_35_15]PJA05771.1 MAG: gliding motility-associated protein GldE [Flavobacteriales bacterium CG_4_10_14_0_2_um_filter_35_18]PJC58998.1 MAG: gliding motility-associated protein GldE [Flavobacteriales bacterium CG_4_9_14_0_2_um_filter_35_242